MLGDLLARCTFAPAGTRVVCASSGGPDSAALVALAVAAGLDVTAVHVHHGLRSTADDDAAAAERIAGQLNVAFRCEHARLDDGANLEARARDARHRLLGGGALFGHTADDQAETVLLALLRGSGATGLSAITPGPTHPLLALRRHETHALCAHLDLRPTSDPTNADLRFRRNRIRNELLPLMDSVAERDVVTLLDRTAGLLRDDDALIDELSRTLDPCDALALAAAPLPLARRAIRRWLTVDGYPPDAAAIARVIDVAAGRVAACEVTGIGRIERSRQRLRITD